MLEVGVVDVGVHSEQALEDHFDNCLEVAREGYPKSAREDLLVI